MEFKVTLIIHFFQCRAAYDIVLILRALDSLCRILRTILEQMG